jgi:DNA (cytosine-5)-methyltransferase 1
VRGDGFTLLDLFAGCGGMTRGFLDQGSFTSVGAVEIDRAAAATYAANFDPIGEHTHAGDITAYTDVPQGRGKVRDGRVDLPGRLMITLR